MSSINVEGIVELMQIFRGSEREHLFIEFISQLEEANEFLKADSKDRHEVMLHIDNGVISVGISFCADASQLLFWFKLKDFPADAIRWTQNRDKNKMCLSKHQPENNLTQAIISWLTIYKVELEKAHSSAVCALNVFTSCDAN